MTTTTIREFRTLASLMTTTTDTARYLIRSAAGRVLVFDLTKDRAEEYARLYYRGAAVEQMAS